MNETMLYVGAAIITIWGIGHLVPTKSIVKDFGAISADNRQIITMEWIAEGLTLCFIGLLVLFVTLLGDVPSPTAIIVYRAAAGMLIAMAILTGLTGARTPILPIKACPYVKTTVAVLFILGSIL